MAIIKQILRRANKEHTCSLTGRKIEKGHRYLRYDFNDASSVARGILEDDTDAYGCSIEAVEKTDKTIFIDDGKF